MQETFSCILKILEENKKTSSIILKEEFTMDENEVLGNGEIQRDEIDFGGVE